MVARAGEGEGQVAAAEGQARVLGQDRAQLAHRPRGVGPRGGDAALQPVHEGDAVLGIAQRRRRGPVARSGQVSERAQAFRRVRAGIGGRIRRARGQGRAQLAPHLVRHLRLLGAPVPGLARVLVQRVQLRPRRVDQLEPRRPPGVEGGPAQAQPREERLGVGRLVGHGPAAERRTQRAAFHRPARRDAARQVQQRRRHVDAAGHDRGDDTGRHPRTGHDPRHAQRGVVDEDAVGLLAVLAQSLAMVRGHEDEGARRPALRLQEPQQPAELRVHEGDLAVVGAAGEPRREVRRRLVGRVGVEVVDPEEPRGRRPRFQPRPGRGRRLVRGTLHVGRAAPVLAVGQVIVVHVEPAREAEAPVQREPGDEGRRPVPRVVEGLGQGGDGLGQHEVAVVAHAVAKRGEPGEDRGVRRCRERHVGDRGREARAAGGQRVEDGGRGAGVTVAADVVGAEGVDGDEQDVGPGPSRGGRTRPRARTGERGGQGRDRGERPAQGHGPSVPRSCRIRGWSARKASDRRRASAASPLRPCLCSAQPRPLSSSGLGVPAASASR